MKKYKISWLSSATKDSKTIYNFCKGNYGVKYAEKISNKLLEDIHSLTIFPYSNPIYFKENEFILRKRIVLKRYLIIFLVFKDYIVIYYIIDGRRNLAISDLLK